MENNYYVYWLAAKKELVRILVLSLAIAGLVFVVMSKMGPTYQVHFSYLVSLSERETADDYKFDGYYAISATDLFAATLAAWAQTPEVIAKAYQKAGVVEIGEGPRELAKSITAEKTAPQLVEITVRHHNKQIANSLALGLKEVMADNVRRYHKEGIPAVKFRVINTDLWQGVERPAKKTVSVATFVFAFLLGINGVVLRESFRRVS